MDQSIIMHGAIVGEGAKVHKAIVLDKVVVPNGAEIGDPNGEKVVIYSGETQE